MNNRIIAALIVMLVVILVVIAAVMFLGGDEEVPPTPTPTATLTSTPTATFTPTPTATFTPTVTPTPSMTPTPLPNTASGIEIPATESKVPTGLYVYEGDVIGVTAISGSWVYGTDASSRGCAISFEALEDEQWAISSEDSIFALIGYVDDVPFLIGCETPHLISAVATGELFLGFNDCVGCFDNNSGVLTVDIVIDRR